jgi:hypothetical protein
MRNLSAIAFLLFALSSPGGDSPKVVEIRNHFRVGGADGANLYVITEIIRLSDDLNESHLLIRDEGHGDFVMKSVWAFQTQEITHRLSDLKDRNFVQSTSKMPFTSKTRVETLAEARQNPMLVDTPAAVRIETNGGVWEGIHTDWDEYGRLRQFRHDLRQTIDPFLLEAMERMRGTVFTGVSGLPDAFYARVARFVVYDQRSDETPVSVKQAELTPDCQFDESFGYPCSEKQLERVRQAAKEGTSLSNY